MKMKVYRDKRHEWRWRLVADNGRIVADSAEGYTRKDSCVRAVERIVDFDWPCEIEVSET